MSQNVITDILLSNQKQNRYLNRDQIDEVFQFLFVKYELKKYIKEIVFDNKSYGKKLDDVSAEYALSRRTIYIYEKSLEDYKRMIADDCSLVNKKYKRVFINEAILQILIHELEHIRQVKQLFESKNYDTEYEILRSAYTVEFNDNVLHLPYLREYYGTSVRKHFGKDYNNFQKQLNIFDIKMSDFYESDPSEQSADYESVKEIIHLNEYLFPEINDIWKNILYQRTQALYICNRHGVISPFEKFVRSRNKILTLDPFTIPKSELLKLPLDKRFSYGLPISKREYYEMEDYIKSMHL